jgi:hypothetical protein
LSIKQVSINTNVREPSPKPNKVKDKQMNKTK